MSTTTQTHLMTVEEFMNIDDDYHRHELIKGELLTMPLPKAEQARVTANLTMLLGQYVKANHLGEVCAIGGYQIESNPDTVLGADVSFVTRDRNAVPSEDYYSGPPDLAVEVISTSDTDRIERKLSLWLQSGARSVWHVNPQRRTVEVISSTSERRILHETDELVDDTVPGFRVKVSEIFA